MRPTEIRSGGESSAAGNDVGPALKYTSNRRTLGVVLTTFGLALECFSGYWSNIGIPVPVDRALLLLGVVICGYDFWRRGGRLGFRALHLWFLVASLWVALSAVLAGTAGGSGLFALIDRFGIGLFAVLSIAPVVYYDEASRVILYRTFTGLGFYLGVTALAEALGLRFAIWPSYISDPSIGIHFDRARGPFVEGVANGLMLSYCGAFAIAMLLAERSRRSRFFSALVVILCAAGVMFTLTRAVWLGAAAAFILVGAFVPIIRKTALVFVPVLIVVLAIAFVSIPGLASNADGRANDQYPVWDRLNTNAAAVRMIEENPLAGIGWHQSSDKMDNYIRQGSDYPVSISSGQVEIHNVFLSRFAEIGLVGLLLWLGAVASSLLLAVLRLPWNSNLDKMRGVLVGIFICWGFAAMLGPVPYLQPNYVLWAVAGVVLSDYLIKRYPDLGTRGRINGRK